MPANVSPRKVQEAVERGFKRLSNFRSARLMFLRQYVGQYYDKESGEIGTEAINLIFNAIRILVPNIVMSFPKHEVVSRFLANKDYAELLTLALNYQAKAIDLKTTYRKAIIDAIFTLGIVKTGLAESDSVYAFDEYSKIDAGTIYSETVDFDNFVADPNSRDHLFRDASFLGDRLSVPRKNLLESGLYKNELIERLPGTGDMLSPRRANQLSRNEIRDRDNYEFEDEVEIVELWVPDAHVIITVPGSRNTPMDDYLRVDDYYGSDKGPYTFLALTPPVSDNPIPVPMVGVWHDLHILANRMAKKVINQAERQKDIVFYRRAAADDAAEVQGATDGEAIAVDDTESLKTVSFGGQQQSNEVMTSQLQSWFNMMAANPQGVGGMTLDADSATEARILQGNANIGLEDMKNMVYQFAAEEASKRAWYLHTDPFIEMPLIRRDQIPAQYAMTAQGPVTTQPARSEDRQVILSPEARRGDWLDFSFDIQPESMGRMDSATRLQQAMTFAIKVLPSVLQSAIIMAQLQMPFDTKQYLIKLAHEAGIDWLDQVFYDPEFQIKVLSMMMQGVNPATSQGQVGQPSPTAGMAAILQNGQPGNIPKAPPVGNLLINQQAQEGANQGQADLRGPGSVIGGY